MQRKRESSHKTQIYHVSFNNYNIKFKYRRIEFGKQGIKAKIYHVAFGKQSIKVKSNVQDLAIMIQNLNCTNKKRFFIS